MYSELVFKAIPKNWCGMSFVAVCFLLN